MITNKEFIEKLKEYPEDAIISIEYCNPRDFTYIKERNLIVIE